MVWGRGDTSLTWREPSDDQEHLNAAWGRWHMCATESGTTGAFVGVDVGVSLYTYTRYCCDLVSGFTLNIAVTSYQGLWQGCFRVLWVHGVGSGGGYAELEGESSEGRNISTLHGGWGFTAWLHPTPCISGTLAKW